MRVRRSPWWLVLVPALALAQDWHGDGRVYGRVLAADGSAAAGAVVRLQLDAGPSGPPALETDEKGRFSVAGLAPGSWTISIDLVGHIVSRGRIRVAEGGAAPVEVRLRSLDEVSPFASEGDASAIGEWIDKGNSFLRDGRAGEARAEYERALGELPWREHAAVLQGVARTYYVEGKVSEALETIQRALSIEPRNEELRGLARGLYEALGRAGDAQAFLDALAEEPREPAPPAKPEATAEEQPAPSRPERALLPPEPHRTGRFRMRLDRRSALSSLEEYTRRYGVTIEDVRSGDPAAGSYEIGGETFEVYVPASYDPSAAHGLLVWVSPTPFGGTERPEIQKLLDERGVLWIGANRSGNERSRWDRTGLALDAAEAMRSLYHVDPARVWAGGYSGGGRVASGLALLWPEVFRGGVFVMGCDFYRDLPVTYVPGASWPASFRAPSAKTLRALRTESRFVIFTGSRDFNLSRSRSVYGAYLDQDFRNVILLEAPGISHYDAVPVEWWSRALDFLGGAAPGSR